MRLVSTTGAPTRSTPPGTRTLLPGVKARSITIHARGASLKWLPPPTRTGNRLVRTEPRHPLRQRENGVRYLGIEPSAHGLEGRAARPAHVPRSWAAEESNLG